MKKEYIKFNQEETVDIFCHKKSDIERLCDKLKTANIKFKTYKSLREFIKEAHNRVKIAVLDEFCIYADGFMEELSNIDAIISSRNSRLLTYITKSGKLPKYLCSYISDNYIEMDTLLSLIKSDNGLMCPNINIVNNCGPEITIIGIGNYCVPENAHISVKNTEPIHRNPVESPNNYNNTDYDETEKEIDKLFGDIKSKSPSGSNYASAFAPSKIKINDTLLVQVFVYKNGMHSFVINQAVQANEKAIEKYITRLSFNIEKGEKITITLNLIPDFDETEVKTLIWDGCCAKASFYITIDDKIFKHNKIYAQIFISVKEVVICEMNFTTKIIQKSLLSKWWNNVFSSAKSKFADVISRSFHKVFISYSHKDEDKVKFIAEGYRALNVDYFFDKQSLRGGDVFSEEIQNYITTSDLFILCWSENAAQSNFIQKEINLALPLAYPQIKPKDKAKLSIYPISFAPYASYPENMKHIYHFVKI